MRIYTQVRDASIDIITDYSFVFSNRVNDTIRRAHIKIA